MKDKRTSVCHKLTKNAWIYFFCLIWLIWFLSYPLPRMQEAHAVFGLGFGAKEDYQTALGKAIEAGNVQRVSQLLSNKEELKKFNFNEVRLRTKNEDSFLTLAARNGNVEIVKMLLALGAEPNKSRDQYGSTPLSVAAKEGHIEIVKLLLEGKSDPNTPASWGGTALHFAARSGHLEIAKLLLAYGADTSVRNKDGFTPVQSALAEGHREVAKLIKNGGAPKSDSKGTSEPHPPRSTWFSDPKWLNDPDVPPCPTSGSTLVPDTGPVAGVVISRLNGWSLDPVTRQPVLQNDPLHQFVIDSLEASGTKIPKIFLMGVARSEVDAIHKKMEKHCSDPKNNCQASLGDWKAALLTVPGEDFRWQQDYFKSSFDPLTGLPVIRAIRDYKRGPLDSLVETETLSKIAREFSISSGDSIPPKSEKNYRFGSGSMGGNFQGLPGGLCMHGEHWQGLYEETGWNGFGRYYCGELSNSVEVDTTWLSVGHVDEVIGLVRDSREKSPCDFAITWASPRKALDLLKDPKNRDQPFFDFFGDATYASQTKDDSPSQLCESVRTLRETQRRNFYRQEKPHYGSDKAGKAAFLPTWLRRIFIQEVQADGHKRACQGMTSPTNAEVAEIMEAVGYNALIEIQMKENRTLLQQKLKERTGCENIKFIPVPDLFYGGQPVARKPDHQVTLDGKTRRFGDLTDDELKRLPIDQRYSGLPYKRALSILPNPTNAVLIGTTLIGPKPWNQAFRNYLQESYESLGLKYKEADTWSAHRGDGNLHCSTNTLRVCRPVSVAGGGSHD